MLVIRVELHSARTGVVTEIGKMLIANVGGTETAGDYEVKLLRKGEIKGWFDAKPVRTARVIGHRRLAEPVWRLVQKALNGLYE